jgi:predicted MFS family arabinose efflux permease
VLAGAVFLTVTSETLPTGLLPNMSSSLHVSEPAVGLLVTIFAFTVVASSAPLSALTRRWPRHGLIVVILIVLACSNLMTAVAPNYPVVVISRILAGTAHGLFWAIVGAYAGHLVPKDQIGRAVSITLGGGTLAFVFGVPLGTFAGHLFGWRSAFVILSVLMLVGAVLIWRFLPRVERIPAAEKASDGTRKRSRDRSVTPVVFVCLIVAISVIGQYTIYTFVAPFMIARMHVSPGDVGALLLVYGVAGGIGLLVAGSVLGPRPQLGMVLALFVSAAAVTLLALFAATPLVAVPAFALWGVAFGTIPPTMQTRLLHTSSAAFRDTASALYTTAFNVGIGAGALLGAFVYGATGVDALPWVFVGIMVISLIFTLAVGRSPDADPVADAEHAERGRARIREAGTDSGA